MANDVFINGKPVEIERKYLIEMPELSVVASQPNYSISEIEQAYITDDGVREGGRIRKRKYADCCKYYKTFKKQIGSITRIEEEFEITEQEYNALCCKLLPDTRIIKKTRHCFDFDGRVWELDVYSFWADKATLEVELDSEDTQVTLPSFIKTIKDVSQDKAYSNFSLARQIKCDL
ncbi:MAG: hypothetical protein K2M82_04255 [Lachnospiraceae bacterium]|nr:hypothetical protein [Lachnospiraceae bacterium]